MAKITATLPLLVGLLYMQVLAILHEPFPSGAGMAHFGTIVTPGGHCSRDPMFSAVLLDERCSAGFAVSALSLFDGMDNFTGKQISEVAAGGFFVKKYYSIKAGISSFDALGIYREHRGIFSCAVTLPHRIKVATEISGTRMSIDVPDSYPLTFGEAGFALLVPIGRLRFVAQAQHVPIKPTGETGGGPSPCVRLALHTVQHAFGAQGISVEITPEHDRPVNCAIGQELRLHKNIAILGGLQNNPFLIGIGVAVTLASGNASVSLVNHPRLGWSRGAAADYGFGKLTSRNK